MPAECANLPQKRTLTNLYNERPTWLHLAHQKLGGFVPASGNVFELLTFGSGVGQFLAVSAGYAPSYGSSNVTLVAN